MPVKGQRPFLCHEIFEHSRGISPGRRNTYPERSFDSRAPAASKIIRIPITASTWFQRIENGTAIARNSLEKHSVLQIILRMEKFSQFDAIRDLFEKPGLADLGPKSRASALTVHDIDHAFKMSATSQTTDLLRAAALLWNDHLDEAHQIVQDLGNADASLLHAIMHRREPDYGNARYWFRKVGEHPSYIGLTLETTTILGNHPELQSFKMIASDRWNPLAFVDACEAAARKDLSTSGVEGLKAIQGIEMRSLVLAIGTR